MRHTDSASLAAVLLISLHLVYPTLAWRDTLPPVNTVTPQYQFLWTMRNGDDVFCDLVVHPGVDNRVLFLDNQRFAIQMKLPEKYDHNFEFYKYITDLLWLKPYEIQVVKGKTKFFKRLKFLNPGGGIDISFYRSIMSRIQKEYLSENRIFQTEDYTPHRVFPVSSTPQLYAQLDVNTRSPFGQKNPRIAQVASPRRFNHLIKIGNEVGMFTTTPPYKITKKQRRIKELGYKK